MKCKDSPGYWLVILITIARNIFEEREQRSADD
jgi:hypothetical protein